MVPPWARGGSMMKAGRQTDYFERHYSFPITWGGVVGKISNDQIPTESGRLCNLLTQTLSGDTISAFP